MQGYRTYIVAALMAAFGALALVDWNAFVANPKDGWIAVAGAFAWMAWRDSKRADALHSEAQK